MKKVIIAVLFVVILVGLTVLGYQKFKLATPAPITPVASSSEPVVTPAPVDQTPVVPAQVGLIVNSPKKNDVVTSPLTISGYVDGANYWTGFEGQVGSVTLVDSAGHVLAQGPLTATTEWTTTTVNFATSLQFSNPATKTGSLIFRNENASGMPERDKKFILSVKF